MTIEKSTTIGATTIRIRLTETNSAQITDQCGSQRSEIHVPLPLLQEFMRAHEVALRTDPNRRHVSIMKATEMCNVSRRTIYNWIASNKVQYMRTAGGSIRIYVDTLWREPDGTGIPMEVDGD